MRFEKGNKEGKKFGDGQDPTKGGRKPKLPDLDELMAEVLGEEKDGKTAAQAILAALRAKAAKGDIRAAEVLLNRSYGFPKQSTDVTSKGEKIGTMPLTDEQFNKIIDLLNK